jgi:hypothetical protein
MLWTITNYKMADSFKAGAGARRSVRRMIPDDVRPLLDGAHHAHVATLLRDSEGET